MKKISNYFLVNVVLLMTGVIFLLLNATPNILEWVSRVLGILFIIPSLWFLIRGFAFKSTIEVRNVVMAGLIPAAGGIFFGAVMILLPELFKEIITMLMGALLVVLGLYQCVYIIMLRRDVKIPVWYLLIPIAVLACGVVVMVVDSVKGDENMVVLITGVTMILFNVTSLLVYFTLRKAPVVVPIPENTPTE